MKFLTILKRHLNQQKKALLYALCYLPIAIFSYSCNIVLDSIITINNQYKTKKQDTKLGIYRFLRREL